MKTICPGRNFSKGSRAWVKANGKRTLARNKASSCPTAVSSIFPRGKGSGAMDQHVQGLEFSFEEARQILNGCNPPSNLNLTTAPSGQFGVHFERRPPNVGVSPNETNRGAGRRNCRGNGPANHRACARYHRVQFGSMIGRALRRKVRHPCVGSRGAGARWRYLARRRSERPRDLRTPRPARILRTKNALASREGALHSMPRSRRAAGIATRTWEESCSS